MKGDFTRLTFDAANHFSRVLMQQGRVTLDADHNEQDDILLHMLRTLVVDLFGPYGGPAGGRGFGIYPSSSAPWKLMIAAGHYYVAGMLCECEQDCDYADQPDLQPVPATATTGADPLLAWLANPGSGPAFWLYLDVWERHITWVEDDRIRESALKDVDTCTRSKVVWQVRAIPIAALVDALTKKKAAADAITPQTAATKALSAQFAKDIATLHNSQQVDACAAGLDALLTISAAQMAARLDPGRPIPNACIIAPDAKYRGPENQLYRVEIHQGGSIGDPAGAMPTFKWSRDNGSVLAAWLDSDGNDIIVSSTRGFEAQGWVEVADDSNDLNGTPGLLVKVSNVVGDRLSIDPASLPNSGLPARDPALHPKIRRWDQHDNDMTTLVAGAVPIGEQSATADVWIALEDGIQVQFAAGGLYRSGDYWLIPARVATGSIEWPSTSDGSGNVVWTPQAPAGIEHHYAPLAIVAGTLTTGGGATVVVQSGCRVCCDPLVADQCPPVPAPGGVPKPSKPLTPAKPIKPIKPK